MATTTTTRPALPNVEALKVARPAAGEVAAALAAAPTYTLAARCMRSGVLDVRSEDWRSGMAAPDGTETVRVPYRPSYLAREVWVGAWYGVGIDTLAGGADASLTVRVLDAAGVAQPNPPPVIDLPPARESSAGPVQVDGAAVAIEDAGMVRGEERLATVVVNVVSLAGQPGFVEVAAERVGLLCVAWAELPPEVV